MESVYGIVPAGARPLYLLVPVILLLLGVLGLLAVAGYASQRARFVLSERGLDFRGDIYGRAISWTALRTADARVVDLSAEPALRPRSRRLGTGLPGYAAGWFRLANGEKALVYLTASRRTLYLPTTAGYAVLLSPREPEEMLAELRSRASSR